MSKTNFILILIAIFCICTKAEDIKYETCIDDISKFVKDNKCIKNNEIITGKMDSITPENFDEECKILNTEECQKLVKTELIGEIIPECKNINGLDNIFKLFENTTCSMEEENSEFLCPSSIFFNNIFKFHDLKLGNAACSMDENGELCPFSIFIRTAKTDLQRTTEEWVKGINEAVDKTCESRKCINSLNILCSYYLNEPSLKVKKKREFNYTIKEHLNSNGGSDTFERIFEYINSDECTSKTNGFEIKYFSFHKIFSSLIVILTLIISIM